MSARNNTFLCPLFLLLTVLSAVFLVHGVKADIDVNIDAAYSTSNELYLIKGNKYVQLIDGVEKNNSTIEDLGLPTNATVHAAMYVQGHGPVFFYTDENGVYHHDAYSTVPDLIKTDIDAAADRLGTDYFFKGCQQVSRWPDYNLWLRARDINEDLPCDMDAAWTEGHDLIALKDNQIWTWGKDGVTGPSPFKKHYKLDSWKLINYYRLRP